MTNKNRFAKTLSSIAFYTAIFLFLGVAQLINAQAAAKSWDGGIGGTIDVNATKNFNQVIFQQFKFCNDENRFDRRHARCQLKLDFYYINGRTLDAKANVSVAGNYIGGNTASNFTGLTD